MIISDVSELTGVIPPITTAFDGKGNVDKKAQREIVDFQKQHVQGFYACGTYGSGPLMDVDQRKTVSEVIIDESDGEVPTVVHVGATATETSVELAKHAESAGADAVASVPPYYYSHRELEVKNHFEALLDAVDLPVLVYNNPSTTGFSFSPEFLNELAGMGISGIKDSSFSVMTFYNFLRKVDSEDFAFIIGTEAYIVPTVPMGAQASVAGLANAIPEPVVELFNTVKDGDMERARELQNKVNDLRDIMHYGPTLLVVQAVLRERGVNAGHPKLPFKDIDQDLLDRVMKDVRKFDII